MLRSIVWKNGLERVNCSIKTPVRSFLHVKDFWNVHQRPNYAKSSCEDRLKTAKWEEYHALANTPQFIADYAHHSFIITKNKKVCRDTQYIFAAGTFLSVLVGGGYILNSFWIHNREKAYKNLKEQENQYFRRRSLEPIALKKGELLESGNPRTISCDILTFREDPFSHFIRIQYDIHEVGTDSNTSRSIFISANELSQEYASDVPQKDSFSFQSITELKMRIENATIDENNTKIYIPRSTKSSKIENCQEFDLTISNSEFYNDRKRWIKDVVFPISSYSILSSTVAFYIAKRTWKHSCENLLWVVRSIHTPWMQGIIFGSKVGLITSTICSFLSFIVICSSYKTKTLWFANNDNYSPITKFNTFEKHNQWIQIPTMAIIFTIGSVVLTSWFVIPASAITGRIVTAKVYQELIKILPRSTIAVRKFTKSLRGFKDK